MKDIAPGSSPSPLGPQPNSSWPRQLTSVGSILYFVADSPAFGTEIWSSDGTPEGTNLLADRCPGPCSSEQQLLGSFAGRLLFTSRFSLWATNPAGGFFRLRQIGHSAPDPVTFRGRLFFFGEDAGGREHLWSTNGTPAGTVHVQEISGLDQPRTAHEPTIVGDRLYFTSWTEAAGQEVWVSDGTAGQELWMTDGTATGTRRVADIAPGQTSSVPADLTAAGGFLFFSAVDSTNSRGLWALDTTQFFAHCVPTADRLCLGGRRFSVTVRFLDPRAGGTEKSATAIPDSDESGFFWFFDRGNLELVVKVLDGRAANGHFWVLFGALSDVEYTVTVTDHATGAVRTYRNPHGTLCGQADTAAFADPAGATAPARFVPHPATSANAAEPAGPCTPGPAQLCLGGGRFRVEARWKDQHSGGREGTAFAVPRTEESGSFWFFTPANTELVVKVLDGTLLNGKFWIFYAALSDVEYWLTVTDTVTGAVKTYHNPPGNYCGRGDTDGL